jgi:hypothetical protein
VPSAEVVVAAIDKIEDELTSCCSPARARLVIIAAFVLLQDVYQRRPTYAVLMLSLPSAVSAAVAASL